MGKRIRPFRYKVFGQGQPVVIIPGLDGITEFFDDTYPALSPKYKIIKYYLPLLDEAKAASRNYSFEFVATDIKKILDELGIKKAHVIGESWGGAVAQVFALEYPDMIDKLVVMSSAPRFDLSTKVKIQLLFFPLVPMWIFARLHVYEVCEPKDPRWAKQMFIRNAEWADHKTVVVRARLAAKFDITERVSKITAPTLIMMGGGDRFTGEGSRLLHKMLPNSKIVEIPDVGHLLHMIKPEQFLEAVEKHFQS